jgi:hypothetical protein
MRTIITRASLLASVAFATAEKSNAAGGESNAEGQQEEALNPNRPVVTLLDKEKVQALKKALGGDRVYYTTKTETRVGEDGKESEVTISAYEQVEEKMAQVATATNGDFFGVPLLMNSPKDSPVNEANNIVVMTLGARDAKTKTNGYKAVVITAQPTVEEFIQSEAAKAFIEKLIQREACDVAFSAGIRSAETMLQLEDAASTLPITVESIVQTQRESGSAGDTDAFDAIWPAFRTGVIQSKAKALYDVLPGKKAVLIRAFRSKSYAQANPHTTAIEEAGMWTRMLDMMIELGPKMKSEKGEPLNIDVSALIDWRDARESTVLTYSEEKIKEVDSIDLLKF